MNAHMPMFALAPCKVTWPKDEISAPAPHQFVSLSNVACTDEMRSESGQMYQTFVGAPFNGTWDVFSAALVKRKDDFLVDASGRRRLTYPEVFARARALMHAFTHEFKLKPLDRVVVVGRNSLEWIIAYIAASWAGMIAVPMNSWWTGAELEFGITDSQARVVFADDERMARLALRAEALRHVVFVRLERDAAAPVSEFDALVDRHLKHAADVPTGQPRGVSQDSACMIMVRDAYSRR